jgi:hypothetical protein
MSCSGEGAAVEVVKPYGIGCCVNDVTEDDFEKQFLTWVTDDFEDGLLHAVAYAFAGFGDPPEASLTRWRDGLDVVGHEEFHQVTVQGR